MSQIVESPPAPPQPDAERLFPRLTGPQIARLAEHGRRRAVHRGEILVEAGATRPPFFVVTRGRIEIVRPSGTREEPIADHGAGEFTGEINMISGRRSLVRARATEDGEVIELEQGSEPLLAEKGLDVVGVDASAQAAEQAPQP